jgi:hypothetical protein
MHCCIHVYTYYTGIRQKIAQRLGHNAARKIQCMPFHCLKPDVYTTDSHNTAEHRKNTKVFNNASIFSPGMFLQLNL